jgi:hypothetical protein
MGNVNPRRGFAPYIPLLFTTSKNTLQNLKKKKKKNKRDPLIEKEHELNVWRASVGTR